VPHFTQIKRGPHSELIKPNIIKLYHHTDIMGLLNGSLMDQADFQKNNQIIMLFEVSINDISNIFK